MAEGCDVRDWSAVFKDLKKHHDEAYKIVEKAVWLEENRREAEAILHYESGLVALDKALGVMSGVPRNSDPTWQEACSMVEKMKQTKLEVSFRIQDCFTLPDNLPPDTVLMPPGPPSYEEATAGGVTPRFKTYQELGAALQNLQVETETQTAHILYSHPAVQIYFISPNGTVTTPSEPDELTIVELENNGGGEKPKAYLQIGPWIYPLVPGVSPYFQADYGAFVLPDVSSDQQGAAVGIMLPKDEDESVLELLHDILNGFGSDTSVPPKPPPRTRRSKKNQNVPLSKKIVSGSQRASETMLREARKAGQRMSEKTSKLVDSMSPGSEVSVHPKVQSGFRVAREVTGSAVAVTGYVASRIGQATMALGRYLAPHVQKQGTRLLTTTRICNEEEASKRMNSVLGITAGAVEGFGTVYDGLEHSAKILGSSLTKNTVKVVEHKYGQPVGEIVGDTMHSTGNVLLASHTISHFSTKVVVKTTSKKRKAASAEEKTLQQNKSCSDGLKDHSSQGEMSGCNREAKSAATSEKSELVNKENCGNQCEKTKPSKENSRSKQ